MEPHSDRQSATLSQESLVASQSNSPANTLRGARHHSADTRHQNSAPKRRPPALPGIYERPSQEVREVEEATARTSSEHGAGYKDHSLQREGSAAFKVFVRKMNTLDANLQSFTNAVGQLGSSVAISSSADELRDCLQRLLQSFRSNAAHLFEGGEKELASIPKFRRFASRYYTRTIRSPLVQADSPATIPEQMASLAHNLTTFVRCLDQIPEFTDQAVNASTALFHDDLMYWSSCLKDHRAGGIPTIKFSQTQTTKTLQNLSTVAALFAAVDATAIQFSYQSFGTKAQNAVNLLWIMSLVFSLASAINSQLAYHWHSAIYRSPHACLPMLISVWIVHSPLMFLVASVLAFSAGLVCFTFSNFHHYPVIPIVITVCTSISSFALLSVGLWFFGERCTFKRTNGKKWLIQVVPAAVENVKGYSGYRAATTYFRNLGVLLRPTLDCAKRQISRVTQSMGVPRPETVISSLSARSASRGVRETEGSLPLHSNEVVTSSSNGDPHTPPSPDDPPSLGGTSPHQPSPLRSGMEKIAATAFDFTHRLVSIGDASRSGSLGTSVGSPPGSPSPAGQFVIGQIPHATTEAHSANVPRGDSAQLMAITSSLKGIDLRFSPKGDYLATCAWGDPIIIWKVDHKLSVHRKIPHFSDMVSQVTWSPDGKYLLLFSQDGVEVRMADGEGWREVTTCKELGDYRAVCWLPTSSCSRLRLSAQLLAVASVTQSPDGLKPSNPGHLEKRILVHNLETGDAEVQIPVLHDARYITLSSEGSLVLVSYEDKASPQLFRLKITEHQTRLDLLHTYSLPTASSLHSVRFVRSGEFCHFNYPGLGDMIVLCADKGGLLYFWDRKSATLLHSIKIHDPGAARTKIAWSHVNTDRLMFATGGHGGTLTVWTAEFRANEASGGAKTA
ncbi:WD40-repeat-containing domain protein [Cantharellus anzutake]|uniref:WD40-repeat-containing domain protein n=1 Tax=Cantharellus anzutake TaxID=1750568 RepID=UPI001906A2EE|nr:WD40-repeat-containing domain protein [Cantharellus anzutake]KAF8322778.1 WD40-repeat-containing domain protein [Cantharellus anzutake]